MTKLTTRPRTIVNAIKCVLEGNTATIETVDDTTTIEVDRCIFDGVSVYHRESGVLYEFDYPTNLRVERAGSDTVLVDEVI